MTLSSVMFVGRSSLAKQLWRLTSEPGIARTASMVIAVLATCQVAASAAEPARSWSEFQNGGRLIVGHSLPTQWSPDNALAWQVDLIGYGQSTPVCFGDRVFVTTTRGENKDVFLLAAYDLNNGTLCWQLEFPNPTPEKNDSYISRSAPTPIIDSEQVVALFEGGVLAAASHDGKLLWQRNVVADYGPIAARHGLASSLASFGDQALVWIERGEEPYLMSVGRTTGETKWKVAGLGSTTWSSPRLIDVGKQSQLVCCASALVVGFDPETGKRLWELKDVAGTTSPTPIPVGDGLFFLGASEGRGEASVPAAKNSNGLVRVTQASDGEFTTEYVWRADKATCSFGSPIVVGKMVYEVNRSGVLYGLDLETGEQKLQQRSGVESIWATPLVADGKLYLFGRRGETSLIDLSSHTVLHTNQLWAVEPQPEASQNTSSMSTGGHTLYAVAVANQTLLLRSGDKLYAIKNLDR